MNNNEEQPTENNNWNLQWYFTKLDIKIRDVLYRKEEATLSYDILDTEKSIQYKQLALKERQRQMKIGEIWQEVIGSYAGFINLKVGHITGLDILSHEKKVAIELKNRTNTDNSSSKKSNLDKVARFKQDYPDYKCIYANINGDTEIKTNNTPAKIIIHNSVEIEHHVGMEFLVFIFGENTLPIIEFVKRVIYKYT